MEPARGLGKKASEKAQRKKTENSNGAPNARNIPANSTKAKSRARNAIKKAALQSAVPVRITERSKQAGGCKSHRAPDLLAARLPGHGTNSGSRSTQRARGSAQR
ncbi:unnamed protein product [Prunus armeniaca]|uniref:Uncharacterized protein n=1 Tax=Prunus armeniaca TaxID=36596 RepID=A0A6J5V807_PRUAR|nr:unnamed protein product [Prunus armeniaca]